MKKTLMPIPSVGDYSFTGGRLYVGKLSSASHARTAAILNLHLKGSREIPVRTVADAGMGETYFIAVTDGGIEIKGGDPGIYAAFSVLSALAEEDDRGTWFPTGTIRGTPQYGYRGVMLDVSRHFFPKEEVLRLLDIMFRLRLNKFHWHISDDQGFRVALEDFPKLEEVASRRAYTAYGGFAKGRGHDGTPYAGCYSAAEVREVCAYAAARGIEVIPELDLPGHMSALIAAYPELSCSGESIQVPGEFGILQNVLCIGNSEAMEFIANLIRSLARLFGAKTFHLGFDEVKLDHLKTCPKCQGKMRDLGLHDLEELKAYAKDQFRDVLKKEGITPIIYNDGMEKADPEVICYHWFGVQGRTPKTVAWINQGQRVIMAPTSHFYLDYPYAWTALKKTYRFDPLFKGIEKPENILGMEAPLWTEHVPDHAKLAFNAYYRMAALAELSWSGEQRRSYGDLMRDLRGREQYYFGESLALPEEVLNPGFFRRLALAKKCMQIDMSYEYKQYREGKL
jgi:hexosaminidase